MSDPFPSDPNAASGHHWESGAYVWDSRRLVAVRQGSSEAERQAEAAATEYDPAEDEADELMDADAPAEAQGGGSETCMVKDCPVDLSLCKPYYRRFRICERHLKTLSLRIEGKPSRFCQQCGRFHVLEEFEGSRRSCRRALLTRFYKRRNLPVPQSALPPSKSDGSSRHESRDTDSKGKPKARAISGNDPSERRKRGRPRAPPMDVRDLLPDDPRVDLAACNHAQAQAEHQRRQTGVDVKREAIQVESRLLGPQLNNRETSRSDGSAKTKDDSSSSGGAATRGGGLAGATGPPRAQASRPRINYFPEPQPSQAEQAPSGADVTQDSYVPPMMGGLQPGAFDRLQVQQEQQWYHHEQQQQDQQHLVSRRGADPGGHPGVSGQPPQYPQRPQQQARQRVLSGLDPMDTLLQPPMPSHPGMQLQPELQRVGGYTRSPHAVGVSRKDRHIDLLRQPSDGNGATGGSISGMHTSAPEAAGGRGSGGAVGTTHGSGMKGSDVSTLTGDPWMRGSGWQLGSTSSGGAGGVGSGLTLGVVQQALASRAGGGGRNSGNGLMDMQIERVVPMQVTNTAAPDPLDLELLHIEQSLLADQDSRQPGLGGVTGRVLGMPNLPQHVALHRPSGPASQLAQRQAALSMGLADSNEMQKANGMGYAGVLAFDRTGSGHHHGWHTDGLAAGMTPGFRCDPYPHQSARAFEGEVLGFSRAATGLDGSRSSGGPRLNLLGLQREASSGVPPAAARSLTDRGQGSTAAGLSPPSGCTDSFMGTADAALAVSRGQPSSAQELLLQSYTRSNGAAAAGHLNLASNVVPLGPRASGHVQQQQPQHQPLAPPLQLHLAPQQQQQQAQQRPPGRPQEYRDLAATRATCGMGRTLQGRVAEVEMCDALGEAYHEAGAVGDRAFPGSEQDALAMLQHQQAMRLHLVQQHSGQQQPNLGLQLGSQRQALSSTSIREAAEAMLAQGGSRVTYAPPTSLLERVSIKLHNCRPEQLPPSLAEQLGKWLSTIDATVVQGFIRPGCTNLILDVLYGDRQRLLSSLVGAEGTDPRVAAEHLVHTVLRGSCMSDAHLRLHLQLREELLVVEGDQVHLRRRGPSSSSWNRTQSSQPPSRAYPGQLGARDNWLGQEIEGVAPIAVVAGRGFTLELAGRGLELPGTTFHIRFRGSHLEFIREEDSETGEDSDFYVNELGEQPPQQPTGPLDTPRSLVVNLGNSGAAAAAHGHVANISGNILVETEPYGALDDLQQRFGGFKMALSALQVASLRAMYPIRQAPQQNGPTAEMSAGAEEDAVDVGRSVYKIEQTVGSGQYATTVAQAAAVGGAGPSEGEFSDHEWGSGEGVMGKMGVSGASPVSAGEGETQRSCRALGGPAAAMFAACVTDSQDGLAPCASAQGSLPGGSRASEDASGAISEQNQQLVASFPNRTLATGDRTGSSLPAPGLRLPMAPQAPAMDALTSMRNLFSGYADATRPARVLSNVIPGIPFASQPTGSRGAGHIDEQHIQGLGSGSAAYSELGGTSAPRRGLVMADTSGRRMQPLLVRPQGRDGSNSMSLEAYVSDIGDGEDTDRHSMVSGSMTLGLASSSESSLDPGVVVLFVEPPTRPGLACVEAESPAAPQSMLAKSLSTSSVSTAGGSSSRSAAGASAAGAVTPGVMSDWWPLVVLPESAEGAAEELNSLLLDEDQQQQQELTWLKNLMVDLGLVLEAMDPDDVACDVVLDSVDVRLPPGTITELVNTSSSVSMGSWGTETNSGAASAVSAWTRGIPSGPNSSQATSSIDPAPPPEYHAVATPGPQAPREKEPAGMPPLKPRTLGGDAPSNAVANAVVMAVRANSAKPIAVATTGQPGLSLAHSQPQAQHGMVASSSALGADGVDYWAPLTAAAAATLQPLSDPGVTGRVLEREPLDAAAAACNLLQVGDAVSTCDDCPQEPASSRLDPALQQLTDSASDNVALHGRLTVRQILGHVLTCWESPLSPGELPDGPHIASYLTPQPPLAELTAFEAARFFGFTASVETTSELPQPSHHDSSAPGGAMGSVPSGNPSAALEQLDRCAVPHDQQEGSIGPGFEVLDPSYPARTLHMPAVVQSQSCADATVGAGASSAPKFERGLGLALRPEDQTAAGPDMLVTSDVVEARREAVVRRWHQRQQQEVFVRARSLLVFFLNRGFHHCASLIFDFLLQCNPGGAPPTHPGKNPSTGQGGNAGAGHGTAGAGAAATPAPTSQSKRDVFVWLSNLLCAETGLGLLHHAVRSGSVPTVELVLRTSSMVGASTLVLEPGTNGVSPLHLAALLPTNSAPINNVIVWHLHRASQGTSADINLDLMAARPWAPAGRANPANPGLTVSYIPVGNPTAHAFSAYLSSPPGFLTHGFAGSHAVSPGFGPQHVVPLPGPRSLSPGLRGSNVAQLGAELERIALASSAGAEMKHLPQEPSLTGTDSVRCGPVGSGDLLASAPTKPSPPPPESPPPMPLPLSAPTSLMAFALPLLALSKDGEGIGQDLTDSAYDASCSSPLGPDGAFSRPSRDRPGSKASSSSCALAASSSREDVATVARADDGAATAEAAAVTAAGPPPVSASLWVLRISALGQQPLGRAATVAAMLCTAAAVGPTIVGWLQPLLGPVEGDLRFAPAMLLWAAIALVCCAVGFGNQRPAL